MVESFGQLRGIEQFRSVMSEKPVVSICCITYNHALFLRKCLDGFLMQQTSFPIEILIHDDASTDGTDEIVREYAARFPGIVFPQFEEENQYSKPNHKYIDLYNYERARGKYIAYCEGDDYWTDPSKLQKQVDFMESHPEYSVCFHGFRSFDAGAGKYLDLTPPMRLLSSHPGEDGIDIDLSLYFDDWYTQPLTMLFRVSMADFEICNRFRYYRDMHEIYYLLRAGKCRLMNFDGGVRNVHSNGVASMISRKKYCDISLPMDGEFYWKTRNKYTKKQFVATLEECVRVYRDTDRLKALRCAIISFLLTGHPRGLVRHVKFIFK